MGIVVQSVRPRGKETTGGNEMSRFLFLAASPPPLSNAVGVVVISITAGRWSASHVFMFIF